jgi:hypothetical protein
MIRAEHIYNEYCYYWQRKQFRQENKLILSMHTSRKETTRECTYFFNKMPSVDLDILLHSTKHNWRTVSACAYCSGCHSKGSLQFPARWKSPHHDREVQWALLRQCSWSQKLFESCKFIETNNRSVKGRSEDQYWQGVKYLRHIRTHPVTWRLRRKIEILTIKKLRGLGPRATAACRRNLCQLLRRKGCHVVSAADPL